MSFTKTISTFAALTTIFGASVAAWKVVEYNESQTQPETKQLEQKLTELQKELQESKKKQEELLNALKTPVPPPLPETDETPPR